jgi:hypothetical protein
MRVDRNYLPRLDGVINPENYSINSATAFCGEQWI